MAAASASDDGFPPLKNDLILRAARGEAVSRIPVWIMRQAGRYLPEYLEYMKDKNFFQVCRNPEMACEITLQPLRRFDLDAAILFSDILVIPQALGLEVEMVPQKGPVFNDPLKSPADLSRLVQPDVKKELGYVFEAITLVRKTLDGKVPLIGFLGAPFTLMGYMCGSGKLFSETKKWLYGHKDESHKLLQMITDVCCEYAVYQVEAGAQMIQVFESSGGELSPDTFAEFSLPYLERIVDAIKAKFPDVPCTVFARGANFAVEQLSATKYDTIQLDWALTPPEARRLVGPGKTIQGNMDPGVLFGSDELIRDTAVSIAQQFVAGTNGRRYIANLGHGMHPTMEPRAVEAFVNAVHSVELPKL